MRRYEGVFVENRGRTQFRIAVAQRIHFLLQIEIVILHPNLGVPGVKYTAIGVLGFLPQGGILGLYGCDELLRLFRDFQLGMHGRQQQQMDSYLAKLRSLFIYGPVSPEEDKDVERDDAEGDDGPTSPLHVFVAKGYQHLRVSFKNNRGILADQFSCPSLRDPSSSMGGKCGAVRESVTAYDLDTGGRETRFQKVLWHCRIYK